MIGFARNNGNMIETGAEFPTLPNNIDKLYLDFETTSGDSKLDSLNPWHNCKPAGYAFTYDKIPAAWYVPWNVPRASEYLRMIIARSKEWINHNVKYDAHVFTNNTYVGITDLPILSDTIVGAKLIDSDRGFGRGGYGLDALARDWLKEDISGYESASGHSRRVRLSRRANESALSRLYCVQNAGRMPERVGNRNEAYADFIRRRTNGFARGPG
jgi:hypothetical protein